MAKEKKKVQITMKQCFLEFWSGSGTMYIHFYFIDQNMSYDNKYLKKKMVEKYKPTTSTEEVAEYL